MFLLGYFFFSKRIFFLEMFWGFFVDRLRGSCRLNRRRSPPWPSIHHPLLRLVLVEVSRGTQRCHTDHHLVFSQQWIEREKILRHSFPIRREILLLRPSPIEIVAVHSFHEFIGLLLLFIRFLDMNNNKNCKLEFDFFLGGLFFDC